MTDPVNYGYLVARRARAQAEGQESVLEVLLVRRPYLTWPSSQPVIEYPGEYMFPGGRFDHDDLLRGLPLLLKTATRSFHQQTGYLGPITKLSYLPLCEEQVRDEFRVCHFFSAAVPHFSNEERDVPRIGFPYKWMTPEDALTLITSSQHAEVQDAAYRKMARYAHFFHIDALPDRVIPTATIKTLERLRDSPLYLPLEVPEDFQL